jgi:periplasmic divalent cation tolerance protein
MVKTKYCVIFITCANKQEAEKIAGKLVEKNLAACVNIVPGLRSLFWWEAKVDSADELLLVVKTKLSRFRLLEKTVKGLHSYTVPEIIALPIIAGNKAYLEWIDDNIR